MLLWTPLRDVRVFLAAIGSRLVPAALVVDILVRYNLVLKCVPDEEVAGLVIRVLVPVGEDKATVLAGPGSRAFEDPALRRLWGEGR